MNGVQIMIPAELTEHAQNQFMSKHLSSVFHACSTSDDKNSRPPYTGRPALILNAKLCVPFRLMTRRWHRPAKASPFCLQDNNGKDAVRCPGKANGLSAADKSGKRMCPESYQTSAVRPPNAAIAGHLRPTRTVSGSLLCPRRLSDTATSPLPLCCPAERAIP